MEDFPKKKFLFQSKDKNFSFLIHKEATSSQEHRLTSGTLESGLNDTLKICRLNSKLARSENFEDHYNFVIGQLKVI